MKMLNINEKEKVIVKTGNGFVFLAVDDVAFVVSDGNYSKVTMGNGDCILATRTLKYFEQQLEHKHFFRCHKRFLVNIAFVKELVCGEETHLKLSGNFVVPVSREGLKRFKEFLCI